jgi:hypothetical protein
MATVGFGKTPMSELGMKNSYTTGSDFIKSVHSLVTFHPLPEFLRSSALIGF